MPKLSYQQTNNFATSNRSASVRHNVETNIEKEKKYKETVYIKVLIEAGKNVDIKKLDVLKEVYIYSAK